MKEADLDSDFRTDGRLRSSRPLRSVEASSVSASARVDGRTASLLVLRLIRKKNEGPTPVPSPPRILMDPFTCAILMLAEEETEGETRNRHL